MVFYKHFVQSIIGSESIDQELIDILIYIFSLLLVLLIKNITHRTSHMPSPEAELLHRRGRPAIGLIYDQRREFSRDIRSYIPRK